MDSKAIAEQILIAGIDKVLPEKLIKASLRLKDNWLFIGNLRFNLEVIENIYVIGAGKASAMMGSGVEKILGSRISDGHIVVKYGHSCKLNYIKVSESGHPVPDASGLNATRLILEIASKARRNDLVLCLLSGGGSSLLTDLPAGSSLSEVISVNDFLIKSGANIKEINTVRKHLSMIKGGQLARAVGQASLVSLILSDVPGDPLDVIASGPTTPDTTTFKQAKDILDKYSLTESAPPGIIEYLNKGVLGIIPETAKPDDPAFENCFNILIGNNYLALEASKQKALELNIEAVIMDAQLEGDTNSTAEFIQETLLKFKLDKGVQKPVCLLYGGETTVKVTGSGLGGRNQHLALLFAGMLRTLSGITILCAGTDGTDGPTDAAGAVVDSFTFPDAISKKIDPEKYLSEFDSYNFFKKAGGHIITGPTMTNVMDIIVVIVE